MTRLPATDDQIDRVKLIGSGDPKWNMSVRDCNALESVVYELESTRAALADAEIKLGEKPVDEEYVRSGQALRDLEHDTEKLRRFKSYVHERLDKAGVPHDPDPEHNAKHGCRIEGRLNWLEQRAAKAESACADMRLTIEQMMIDCESTHEDGACTSPCTICESGRAALAKVNV